ncbi:MAG: UbiD family decarboxylase [Thermoproteales archaeon]|nr:UbiD family decarboxylase [Thermoproteales archaeon]
MEERRKLKVEWKLRDFLDRLYQNEMLKTIDVSVSTDFEISYFLKKFDGKNSILFNNIKSYKDFRILGNLFTKREILYMALNVFDDREAFSILNHSLDNPKEVELTKSYSLKSIGDDIFRLPVLKYYEKDAGKYMTSSIVIGRDIEEGYLNASIHRMLVLDEKHLAIRLVPRHLYFMYNKSKRYGKDLEIAIVIGASPYFYIASASSPPYGVYELYVANTLSGGMIKGIKLDSSDIIVPEDTEILIRGRILRDKMVDEGPFVDITGTYDIVRKQPVVEIDEILIRENPIYYAILPAGREHRTLMGFPREARIWSEVSKVVPEVKAVRLTNGGCGWLSAIVSIKKVSEGDGKNAIMAAFTGHPSLKMVTVVDTDINVDDPDDVEWALSTRMQPDEDILIISHVRGSSLDPSADQEKLITSKLGIDATRPLYKRKEDFEKAKIPYSEE